MQVLLRECVSPESYKVSSWSLEGQLVEKSNKEGQVFGALWGHANLGLGPCKILADLPPECLVSASPSALLES